LLIKNAPVKQILIVSLNAAVDRIVYLPHLYLNQANRSTYSIDQAGGKGINVARALKALGHEVLVIGMTGGNTGNLIREDLLHSHIPCSLIPLSGRSRNCYILVDQSNNTQTVINEPGPVILPEEYQLFCHELNRRLEDAALLVCSGSLPQAVAPGCYGDFVAMARAHNVPTLVDATGDALGEALPAQPYFVKPNREEAEGLLGHKVTDENAVAAAQEIARRGATVGLISLGSSGAVAVWDDQSIFVPAPQVPTINAVACGDTFLAGCAAAILAQKSIPEMLYWGVAAGSANARAGGAARITRQDFEELLQQVTTLANQS
jgi:tagatose 6-phosphate kinase